jgi:glycosyltransferase involved in cell wall biosynthesis
LPDAVVTTGESIRNYLINQTRLSPDKIVSIPTGIDLSVFNPDIVDASIIRREFAINDDAPVIGTVGMIRKMKGHNVFINAASIIRSYIPNVKFLVVGDTPPGSKETGLKDELIQLIKSLGLENDIILTGYRNDIPAVMASLNVFVLPSTEHEGVPQVISQAMAMGCPVVASDIGAVNEQVIPDVTGKLIPPGNAEIIALSVIDLIKNTEKAREMGRNGRLLVERKFSLKSMIESTESLYEMLLNC